MHDNDLSIVKLILEASLVVQLVMLLLLVLSVVSWSIMVNKFLQVRRAKREADAFEQRFWSGGDLSAIYRDLSARSGTLRGLDSIFEAGFREFVRLRKQGRAERGEMLDSVGRAMRVAQVKAVERIEGGLPFLATVGSTSPYIGLFGTVWGIMNAFRALGNVKNATLAMVAPGIVEALVATAMGLFAAIPAVIAYNAYTNRVERLETRFETFMEEFIAVLRRNMDPDTPDTVPAKPVGTVNTDA